MHSHNLKSFLFVFSMILIVEGLAFLLCLPVAVYYKEALFPYYLPGLISLSIGVSFYLGSDRKFRPIRKIRKAFLLISLCWLAAIFIGIAPYVLSNTISSPIDIAFETISGFTTTGSSVISHVEGLPRSIVFWRSLTQWVGGFGAILTAVIFLSEIDVGGSKTFSLNSALGYTPELRLVSKRLALIYCTLTVSQILMLHVEGMDLFDSLCYSMGTASTGSFSPITGNLSSYPPYTQYTMTFFMLLSGLSYVLYYLVITRKAELIKWKEERNLYFLIILFATLVVTTSLFLNKGQDFESSFRNGFFQVVSFISCNGYSTVDYTLWTDYNLQILCFLLFIGGCFGSASGGIKVSRLLVFFKNIKTILKKLGTPSTKVFKAKYNGKEINSNGNLSILSFITLFFLVFLFGILALSAVGLDLKRSAFLTISALSTFGHSLDIASIPTPGKITLCILMIAGRLEIYPILLLVPSLYTSLKKTFS